MRAIHATLLEVELLLLPSEHVAAATVLQPLVLQMKGFM